MVQLMYSTSFSYLIIIIFIIVFLGSNLFQFSTTSTTTNCYDYVFYNSPDRCQNGVHLRYPFWYTESRDQQYYCGYPGLGITCSPSGEPIINISNESYYVIQYEPRLTDLDPQWMTIVVPDFVEKSCPRPRQRNLTIDQNSSHSAIDPQDYYDYNDMLAFYLNCTSPPPAEIQDDSYYTNRSQHLECLDYKEMRSYCFKNLMYNKSLVDWNKKYCKESVVVPIWITSADDVKEYMQMLQNGFRMGWRTPIECQRCESSGGVCSYNVTARSFGCSCKDEREFRLGTDGREYCFNYGALQKKILIGGGFRKTILIGVFTGVGGLILITILFVYHKNQRKRKKNIARNVEQFLESYGCGSFQRYKYRDIKKMTNSFRDRLGQGGYGSVFKGKLLDGRLVAVKVLINDPKKSTNGEDFINEVATIGRTNHVNIVALLGYCSSGSKRALVYEFMSKGSLEKFIYAKQETSTTIECTIESISTSTTSTSNIEDDSLGWEKLYQIALGIARGLEYLHRGCNTGRILHFDIKPHNILLDENFCPKISDFGLAKLCPTRESIVSMLSCGRGTIGYIAPEIYKRNFGGVSHKSDVYSYGMMVLEMVGGRKNIDPFVNNTSEIYFPHWIYNQLEKHKDKIEGLLRFEEAFDEEIARKMIMVGLWCIQTPQAHRPSMSKVVEMLEGNIKDLQMPPNPYEDSLHPPPFTT